MTTTLSADVLQDDIAVTLARVVASANRRAREAGVDVAASHITMSQAVLGEGLVWRVEYVPADYLARRGGDFIVDVDPEDASIRRALRGQ